MRGKGELITFNARLHPPLPLLTSCSIFPRKISRRTAAAIVTQEQNWEKKELLLLFVVPQTVDPKVFPVIFHCTPTDTLILTLLWFALEIKNFFVFSSTLTSFLFSETAGSFLWPFGVCAAHLQLHQHSTLKHLHGTALSLRFLFLALLAELVGCLSLVTVYKKTKPCRRISCSDPNQQKPFVKEKKRI